MSEVIRVLHVDDEPDFGDLTATFLKRADERFVVETRTSAAAGLERLAAGDVDCVVSDYQMPETDGLEFLEAVRETNPDLPFVLFTGQGSEAVASEAITAGATDYLQKESGTEQFELLANRVANAVDQYRSHRRASDLERIRTLASDVNQVLVRASTRAEIERRIPEVITESDPYRLVVTARVDPESSEMEAISWAGLGADAIDPPPQAVEFGPSERPAPVTRAVEDHEIGISHDVQADPDFEPWRETAREFGFRAFAAVPLVFEETLYGVLVLVTDRLNAFDESERALLRELGDDIAHAIQAAETKRDLRQSKERFQALFENAPGPVIAGAVQRDGDRHEIFGVNDAFEDQFGFEADAVVGEDVGDVLVPDAQWERHATFREKATAGEPVTAEVERQTESGPREFLLDLIPYGRENGIAEGWYAWYTDITDRARREERVAHQQSVLEAILDTCLEGILLVDEEREYVTWNQEFLDMWDVPPELVGDEPEELALEWALEQVEDPDAFIEQVEYLYDHPEAESRDQISLCDGRVFDRYSAPVEGDDGNLYGRVWFFRDVTVLASLHEATQALMAATSPGEVADIAARTLEGILEMDLTGVHLYDSDADALVPVSWSAASEATFDGPPPTFEPGESIAWQVYERGEARYLEDVRETEAVLNDSTPVRSELYVPIGDHGVMLASSTTVDDFDPANEVFTEVLATNVEAALDRVERERALAEERDKYESLVEGSHDGIVIIQDERFVYANERCMEMVGYDEAELIGSHFSKIARHEDEAMLQNRHERRLDPDAAEPPAQYETRVVTKGGDARVAELSATRIQYEGQPAVLLMIRDVTDRRRYQERLEQRTEELEALNRVVRHDIRNDMTIVLGWAELLEDHVDAEGREYLQKILASGEHIVELTDIARDYVETLTTDEALAVSATPLRSTLRTEIDLIRESLPEATFAVDGEIPNVEVQANEMLGSVFRNLLNNAVQHNDGDAPLVEVSCHVDGETVAVRIADDGPGIPDEQKEEVFGKGEKALDSPGTGIGLYLVHTLVGQYDGEVWVEDNEPRGSVFVVRLPLAE